MLSSGTAFHGRPFRVREDEELLERARSIDSAVEAARKDFVVFLLGSGYPTRALELRKNAAEALKRRGYNIVVMEEVDSVPLDDSEKALINDKFWEVVNEYQPSLFLILVSQSKPPPTGVVYELGLLVGKYGREGAVRRIRFCIAEKVDRLEALPRYVRELLREIPEYPYRDGDFDHMVSVLEDAVIAAIVEKLF